MISLRFDRAAELVRRSLGITLALLILPTTGFAATKYAGEFLKVPAGARAVGMGGAFAAVADDATSPYWNPAGVSFLHSKEVLYQHASSFGSAVNYNYASVVLPLKEEGETRPAIAFSLIQLGVSDIPVTPDANDLIPGVHFIDNDEDPGTNLPSENNNVWDPGERLLLNSGSDLSLQSANDWALFFSYGRPLGQKITVGANVKFLYRTLPGSNNNNHSAFGAGMDLGMTFQAMENVTLAFVAHDITTTVMVWDTDTKESIGQTFVMAGAYTARLAPLHMLTLALDVPFNFDGQTIDQRFGTSDATRGLSGTLNAGAEYWYHNTLGLRTGMMGRDLTFGAGVRYNRIGGDYAAVFNRFFGTEPVSFQGDSDLDTSHRISASYNF